MSGEAVKRYTWWAASANSFWLVSGKENAAAVHAEVARTGKSVKEVGLDVGLTISLQSCVLIYMCIIADVLHPEWEAHQKPMHTDDA